MASSSTIRIEQDGPIRLIELNRPAKLNALSLQMKDELMASISAASGDSSVRAVVLTGSGRAFCTGADLKDLAPESGHAYRERLRDLQRGLIEGITSSPKPFIAAVNGPAVGGGLGIGLACDLIVASTEAYFWAPTIGTVGVAPDFGLAVLLPQAIGASRARSMLLLGDRLEAPLAHSWGLVHEVVTGSELLHAAHRLANRIASAAPLAVAATKRLMAFGQSHELRELLDLEASEQAFLRLTADHEEAAQAYREQRAPQYKGR